ncbi:MAG: hypothetical protein HYZ10_05825 [Ignavibacteriales bacterium]|nr:MAG: hypothetical protein FD122_807 [Stygiobacter sp.]KAF0210998.1 MAG: hypothetical protein FD178_3532 [Ignavibacteria bacterium]MBI3123905.1 hypothetical protein [Ignavibacteriales bacterium]OGU86043.1 MAG: hypothetical protein A2279_07405 [Stygiobacter sp. RIFOXYA12_FULL_38_9]OGV07380.1 MAG: hypothetical protein A2299_00990 [Stygiobacter sp. RIFOXYB2_FULL_37_11]OGV14683.1 MAG: hypothetical protein A2440_09260 [Stygiobacter sp. RIFOXYC2_FULL_38_25]OGV18263.1 MAG: hypothetical protein A22
MSKLQSKIETIKRLLAFVGESLDNLSFETFDSVFPAALTAIKQVHRLKFELATEYDSISLKSYENELFSRAKLIEDKFDNIVEVFSEEEKRLEKELYGTIKQKKLTAYKR